MPLEQTDAVLVEAEHLFHLHQFYRDKIRRLKMQSDASSQIMQAVPCDVAIKVAQQCDESIEYYQYMLDQIHQIIYSNGT